MQQITRTIYSADLQTRKKLGLPFKLIKNTTLNEKFNVMAGVSPAVDEMPVDKYLAIGNKGVSYTSGISGISITKPNQHKATDAALFNHIPFVIRTADNDLTAAERANYALRVKSQIDGLTYYAYYLRRIDLTNVVSEMVYQVTKEDKSVVTSAFEPDSSNLNPTPTDVNLDQTNLVSNEYVSSTAKVEVLFTEWEIAELIHVGEVIYKDSAYSVITELAICSGVDRVTQINTIAGTTNMLEAIAVQIAAHGITSIDPRATSEGGRMTYDLGCTESLYKIASQ